MYFVNGSIVLTYEVAMAASRDAGNRNMRKHGRKAWNDDDWNVSVDEFERLWSIEQHMEQKRIEAGAAEAGVSIQEAINEQVRVIASRN